MFYLCQSINTQHASPIRRDLKWLLNHSWMYCNRFLVITACNICNIVVTVNVMHEFADNSILWVCCSTASCAFCQCKYRIIGCFQRNPFGFYCLKIASLVILTCGDFTPFFLWKSVHTFSQFILVTFCADIWLNSRFTHNFHLIRFVLLLCEQTAHHLP